MEQGFAGLRMHSGDPHGDGHRKVMDGISGDAVVPSRMDG